MQVVGLLLVDLINLLLIYDPAYCLLLIDILNILYSRTKQICYPTDGNPPIVIENIQSMINIQI